MVFDIFGLEMLGSFLEYLDIDEFNKNFRTLCIWE
jgi:hypothetical protein